MSAAALSCTARGYAAEMAELTRAQAADKAGVEPEYVDRLIQLGVVVPDGDHRLTTGDVRRAQLARTLEGAGIGLEALAAGMRSGRLSLGFMDTPAYQRFATLSGETFQQVSERSGVPLELLMLGREATGGAMPSPDDRIREDELILCRTSAPCWTRASGRGRSSASYASWATACGAWPRRRATPRART